MATFGICIVWILCSRERLVPFDHFVNSIVPILPNRTRNVSLPMNLVTHKFPLFPSQISSYFCIHGRCRLRSKNSLSRQSKNLSLIEMHSNRFPFRGLFLMELREMVINRTQKRMCYRRFTHFSLPNLFHARAKTVLRSKVCGLEGPLLIWHGSLPPSVSL